MNAGKLRDRVVLQSREAGTDAWGQPLEGWADVALLWAHVRFLSGVEAIKSGAETATATATASVRIRKRDVTTAHRLLIAGKPYDITAVLPALTHTDLTVKDSP